MIATEDEINFSVEKVVSYRYTLSASSYNAIKLRYQEYAHVVFIGLIENLSTIAEFNLK